MCYVSAYCLVTIALAAWAQSSRPIPLESAKQIFTEAQTLCQADGGRLWGVSLCAPIMLVDHDSRSIVASQVDANGALQAEGGVFVGTMPKDQNIANTAVEWSGVHWTQIVWPLPDEASKRHTLIAHELYHRIQNQLDYPTANGGDNAQLDTLEGRYTLQLEWRALTRALGAPGAAERRAASGDAMVFRAERYRLFPEAAAKEQALEFNEGLAEYTGVRVGNPAPAAQLPAALSDLSGHVDDPSFVRSFAYATGPAYGLLLDRYLPEWHRQLKPGMGFDVLLRNALHFKLPGNLQQATEQRAARYDGTVLRAAETSREAARQQLVAHNKAKFIDGAVLILQFRHMQIQFDPRNLQPLGSAGTVYPTLRVSDDWGVLDVSDGALLKSDWSCVTVSAPAAIAGSRIKGDGWSLDLKRGWKLVPGTRSGDYLLEPDS